VNLPYTITPGAITVVVGNRPKVVTRSAMNFDQLAAELRQPQHNVDLIAELADISTFIARVTHGEVQIAEGAVRWRGQSVKNVIAERLIDLLQAGHDTKPISNFLDRVMQNPDDVKAFDPTKTVQDELFLWLESGAQPITPDGMILAFKKVDHNYKDLHTHSIDNSVGKKPYMPRSEVDPDRNNTCSRGFHFCSLEYLKEIGSSSDPIMIVLVDPAAVVAIPADYRNQKGRCWVYEVVGEVEQDRAGTFFTGSPVVEVYREEEDEQTEDESQDDTQTFSDNEIVTFVGDNSDEDTYELTSGNDYTLLFGSDNGEVQLTNDEDENIWVPESLFQKTAVEETDQEDLDALAPTTDTEEEEQVPEQAAGKAPLMFHHGKKTILASELLSIVKEHGQRGYMRLTGVPRTTLQGWLKAIANQA
jgi:hypothetical protein